MAEERDVKVDASKAGTSGISAPQMSGSVGYTGPGPRELLRYTDTSGTSGAGIAGQVVDPGRVVEAFKAAEFKEPLEANEFFKTFGPGNVVEIPDKPYERFCDYEQLLLQLRQPDQDKYQRMHKGTPFGFMSWLSFDLRNYEKALFYLVDRFQNNIAIQRIVV